MDCEYPRAAWNEKKKKEMGQDLDYGNFSWFSMKSKKESSIQYNTIQYNHGFYLEKYGR